MPEQGPATEESERLIGQFGDEQERVAPSLALRWAVQAVAKAGTLGVIGVYPRSTRASRSARR